MQAQREPLIRNLARLTRELESAQRLLADIGITTTAKMVGEVLPNRPLPADATHLRSWLEQAKAALA